jgi:hypothetical protein
MAKGLTPLLCVSPLYGHEAGEFFVAHYHSSLSDCAQSSISGSLTYFNHLSTLQRKLVLALIFLQVFLTRYLEFACLYLVAPRSRSQA